MDYSTLRSAIATSPTTPETLLRTAVPFAREFSREVKRGLLARRTGTPFTRRSHAILLRGLYVCAAAKRTELWPHWISFLKVDRDTFEDLFGLLDNDAVARITLSLMPDGQSCIDDVFALICDPTLCWAVRIGSWQALARLTAEGRVDVSRTLELIDNFHSHHLRPGDDYSLLGWRDAIILLRQGSRFSLIEQSWKTHPFWRGHSEIDKEDARKRLAASLASEGMAMFDAERIAAIDDPVDGLEMQIAHEACCH
jgi:hypothetical protein